MRGLKIRTQFGILLGICALLFIFGFYLYNTQSLKFLFAKEFQSRTRQTTETVKLGLEIGLANENLGSIKTVFDWVKETNDFLWIVLFDQDGQKIASFPEDNESSKAELDLQFQTQSVSNESYLQKESWTSPIASGNVYIGFSTKELRSQEKTTLQDSLVGGLIILTVFAVIILILVSTLAQPLESLRSVTEKITSGEMQHRALTSVQGNFEVMSLVGSFNIMMDALEQERRVSEELLLNILPAKIADRLKKGEKVIADYYENISIIFADLVGFTELASKTKPHELVDILNSVFREFDEIAEDLGVEKIKTIGDAYLAAVGLIVPEASPSQVAVRMARRMIESLEKVNKNKGAQLQVRIGVHTGPVVAGVIGKKKFVFDLWGDAVNIASRLESHGLAGKIHVSRAVVEQIGSAEVFQPRGMISIKGKGDMETFFFSEVGLKPH